LAHAIHDLKEYTITPVTDGVSWWDESFPAIVAAKAAIAGRVLIRGRTEMPLCLLSIRPLEAL
jgi:hypothetical protein